MSFQAYLDGAETKTGLTPQQILELAHAAGLDPASPAGAVLAWLKEELGLGRGHGMALVHVLRHGPTIASTHVGSTGTHRDASTALRLDGLAARARS